MKERKILAKDVKTIEKWTQGALARRRFKKMVHLAQFTKLKKPAYIDGKLTHEKEVLFTDDDIAYITDFKAGGKGLHFNTKTVDIQKDRTYVGQWKADKFKSTWEGIGVIHFPDGSKYQGMTKNGMFHGKGRMTHSNGDIYQGEWENNKASGTGVFVDQAGSMYDGEWLNDQYHGQGCEQWNYNKIIYTGQFVEGRKTGKGRFEFDGNVYEGDFVDGQFHGKGKYYFAESGKVYEGDFYENNMHGQGTMTWTDGTFYEGDFNNGKMDGFGQKNFSNGDKYNGEFKDDMRWGEGNFYDAKKAEQRQGTWREDRELEPVKEDIGTPWRNMRKTVRVNQQFVASANKKRNSPLKKRPTLQVGYQQPKYARRGMGQAQYMQGGATEGVYGRLTSSPQADKRLISRKLDQDIEARKRATEQAFANRRVSTNSQLDRGVTIKNTHYR